MGPLGAIQSKAKDAAINVGQELAFGAQGSQVSALQQKLANAGEKVAVDGKWGDETEAAVRSYQAKHGLKVDGIVGEKTQAKLSEVGELGGGGPKASARFDLTKELASADSELSVAIGMAEGTRTADGGKTSAYNGHTDPGNDKLNQGTFSYQGTARSPREADQKQLEALRKFRPEYEAACRKAGIDPGNKLVAAACFDLYNQAPEAVVGKGGLLDRLPDLAKKGLTEGNLAKARKESFFNPETGKYETNFGSIRKLEDDQKRRMAALADKVGGGQPTVAGASEQRPAGISRHSTKQLEKFNDQYETACQKAGIDPENKLVKAACFDLFERYPSAATAKGGLLDQLPAVAKKGLTVENLTKARVDAFYDPDTQKWDGGPTSPAEMRIEQDQQMGEIADKLKRGEVMAPPARPHTPVPEGKIGFGSQGPEVLQLKKDLKAAGFYDGVLNDKMGNDGVKALEKAKKQLDLPGPKDIAGAETLKAIGESSKWPTVNVQVDFLSQVAGGTPRARSSDCSATCEQMMRETSNVSGRVVPGNHNGYVMDCGANDLKGTKSAVEYLTGQLKAGKPVMIGVDYKEGTGPNNKPHIDHYLVVTGMGVDKQGRQYITFNDPQRDNAKEGTHLNSANRLYKVGDEFKQLDVEPGWRPYNMLGVVRNM